jgi:hypothetical protein
LAQALRFGESTVANVAGGQRAATPIIAFRVARFARVGLDDVLGRRFPEPGACPHCGHRKEDAPRALGLLGQHATAH